MKKRLYRSLCFLALGAAMGGLCACGGNDSGSGIDQKEENTAKAEFFGMDTYMTFTAYGSGAEDALEEAKELMQELEGLWSVTDEGSEIYQVNHGNGETVPVSERTAEIVDFALDMAAETQGALEPTIYPVLSAWGFTTGENRIPETEELEGLLRYVGYEQAEVDGNRIRRPEGMELDLGAVGKGYAGDLVTELLKERGIRSALLDLGGNIQMLGSRPDGSEWRLGIRNPFGEGSIGVLSVSDCAVVTSGNYERHFTGEDGKEYGHIIDPDTGYPAENELAAVTIIAEEGKKADALSTAMLVKGPEGAKEYWSAHQDFEMIAVTDSGTIYLTEGIRDQFSLSGAFANMKISVWEQ
ncbi:MAG: FAD:protein FMN transferase [Schaedlerella sp.]|uniref:FAD:protein FMN transferase n=1 Tax=Schaedlerella sp. TaxID=2676057 RepID=UPI0035289180